MANNVFGNPITDEALKGILEEQVRERQASCGGVEEKVGRWSLNALPGLQCYEDIVKFVSSHDWWGHLGPAPYPSEIANGKWGAFIHVKRDITPEGSNAAVVYRGKNEIGHECDWMVAWDNPWNKVSCVNKVYTEIREVNHFHDVWEYIFENILEKMSKTVLYHQDIWNGCRSTVSIGNCTSPILEAVLTLETIASNVFGNPITDEALKGNPKHYVEELKKQWGNGVSTLCLVYNATADTVKFVSSHDWSGQLGPAPYPSEIANGQWGAFLHVKRDKIPEGSNAAVVYRGKNEIGSECDWMVAWDNPLNKVSSVNKVYTEIRGVNHFHDKWGYISDNILKKMSKTVLYHQDTSNGCRSTCSIGDYTSSIFEAVLTLAPDN
ncbi:hypothetical protein SLE2022_132810 [Rubroshorea leprosula]